MLADDAVLFREGMARILTDTGFTVTGRASDGATLLELVRADPPEVAVIDLRMPPGTRPRASKPPPPSGNWPPASG